VKGSQARQGEFPAATGTERHGYLAGVPFLLDAKRLFPQLGVAAQRSVGEACPPQLAGTFIEALNDSGREEQINSRHEMIADADRVPGFERLMTQDAADKPSGKMS